MQDDDNTAEFLFRITRVDCDLTVEFEPVGKIGDNIEACAVHEALMGMMFRFAELARQEDHADCVENRNKVMVSRFSA
jgi:hypothetical protein